MTDKSLNEELQRIRKLFYAYRNGMLADTLRNAGNPCKIIFGLNIPQLTEISHSCTPSLSIADALWSDKCCREARILATYLFPKELIDEDKAKTLMSDVQTTEEADMLTFKLLKHLPFATSLISNESETTDSGSLAKYLNKSLMNHLS
jgi:hypothetical protein